MLRPSRTGADRADTRMEGPMRVLADVVCPRIRMLLAVSLAMLSIPAVAVQQASPFSVEYTVEVKDTEAQLFHVTARFRSIHQPQLELGLPVWTPGWYTIEYYAKNVSHFVVADGEGHHLA